MKITDSINVGVTLDTNTDLMPGEEMIAIVQSIEAMGFESVWLTDTFGREPFVLASILLANTNRIRVGTGIASVYGRDGMTTRQAQLTLSEMYPDRFLLGLGVSAPYSIEMRKAEIKPPARKFSEFLDGMQSSNIMIAETDAVAPLYLAAHGPLLQGIAKDRADGILSWVMPPQHTALARQRLGSDPAISAQLPFMLIEKIDESRQYAREYLNVWLNLPWYHKAWISAGFSQDDIDNGGSDELIDSIVCRGGAEAVADQIERFSCAGANRVILQPLRETREGEPGDKFHQNNIVADWPALEAVSSYLDLK